MSFGCGPRALLQCCIQDFVDRARCCACAGAKQISSELACNAAPSRWEKPLREGPVITLNVPWEKSTLSLSSRITEPSLLPVLSVCACGRARVARAGLDSSTFGFSADHGSATPTGKCSDVSSCVTLFPVTFSAINLQTYSDGVPLWGYIVFMSHHFLDGTEGVRPMRWRFDRRMEFVSSSISCRRLRLPSSYWYRTIPPFNCLKEWWRGASFQQRGVWA